MQTLVCVKGLHNCLEFSQLPLVFRWSYGNTEKVFYCLNKLNYLNKVLFFLVFLILPFSFEASNSELPSLLQKLLPLHFIRKITALCCILITDECTPIPCKEFLICYEFLIFYFLICYQSIFDFWYVTNELTLYFWYVTNFWYVPHQSYLIWAENVR